MKMNIGTGARTESHYWFVVFHKLRPYRCTGGRIVSTARMEIHFHANCVPILKIQVSFVWLKLEMFQLELCRLTV